jgi:coenzyme F420-0:L-glutamate ligase/coenzyme F420-1:gamma-L-glutamate ligase
MELLPLKSERVRSEDDLLLVFQKALDKANKSLKNGDILVIASKALAYSQGCIMEVKDKDEFKNLIKEEADVVLSARPQSGDDGDMMLTMKNKVLIPNAGIDNSNVPKNHVVLWPRKPFDFAMQIRETLMKEYKLKKFGVLISDSHCQPLRMGTSGIAIGWAGFYGIQDERNKKDLFRKKMKYTQIAMADDLASAANVLMGETNASIPFVIVRGAPVKFTDEEFSEEDYFISPKECIYKGLYKDNLY